MAGAKKSRSKYRHRLDALKPKSRETSEWMKE